MDQQTDGAMHNIQFPLFGTAAGTPGAHQYSSFAECGFLSTHAESLRWSLTDEKRHLLDWMKVAVGSAHKDIQVLSSQQIPESEWPGLGFWERSLEACQAAAILADRGMVGSAASVLRTGYECMIYASALWIDSSLIERIRNQAVFDKHHMAKWVRKVFSDSDLNAELWAKVDSFQTYEGGSRLNTAGAAEIADLKKPYTSVWMALSSLGVHATERSIARYAPRMVGTKLQKVVGPQFEDAVHIFRGSVECLRLGQGRFRQRFSQLSFGPPIPEQFPEFPVHPPS